MGGGGVSFQLKVKIRLSQISTQSYDFKGVLSLIRSRFLVSFQVREKLKIPKICNKVTIWKVVECEYKA